MIKPAAGEAKPSEAVTARQVSLNELVDEDVLLLKIDAAGYEDEVLKGALGLIMGREVAHLLVEIKQSNDVTWKARFVNEMRDTHGYVGAVFQEWYLRQQWE